MQPAGPEIVIIERVARVAHPSFGNGGYVVLDPGTTAYRNAALVSGDPKAMLSWCRDQDFDVLLLPDREPSTLRHRVRFPDEASFAAFEHRFRSPKGRA
jgi:hypothetical protein